MVVAGCVSLKNIQHKTRETKTKTINNKNWDDFSRVCEIYIRSEIQHKSLFFLCLKKKQTEIAIT